LHFILYFYKLFCTNGFGASFLYSEKYNKHTIMKNTGNLLLEGMERLGLIAARIRQNKGSIPQIEIDIILQELRNLYMEALQLEAEGIENVQQDPDASAEAVKNQAEAQRKAEEEAARKAAEAQRKAEEEAARKAAEAQRKAEDEAARKAAEAQRKAEEEAARKAAEAQRKAEEEAARKAAEARRKAEEEAARKAAEAQRKAEEEAARKAAEARRKAEEEAARKAAAEELKPIFAPEPAEQETAPVVEPVMEKLEGNRNDELFSDNSTPASQPKKKPQESSLFDYFNNSNDEEKPRVRTLADTLNKHGRNVEEQLETRVNAKKVDDLRTIININDKFSFMSELFHNNMKAYNDFILRLNSYTNREEALAYVAEVAAQYMWHENSLVVKSFYKVFDRKF